MNLSAFPLIFHFTQLLTILRVWFLMNFPDVPLSNNPIRISPISVEL